MPEGVGQSVRARTGACADRAAARSCVGRSSRDRRRGRAGDRQDNGLAPCAWRPRGRAGIASWRRRRARRTRRWRFRAWAICLTAWPMSVGRLPDPQRRALGAALFLSDASEAPGDLDALPRAVLGVLRRLAVEATVVVAIDDEQWLDRASGRALAFALRRVRDERICCCCRGGPTARGRCGWSCRRSYRFE